MFLDSKHFLFELFNFVKIAIYGFNCISSALYVWILVVRNFEYQGGVGFLKLFALGGTNVVFEHNVERYKLSEVNGLEDLFRVLLLVISKQNIDLPLNYGLKASDQSLDDALLEISAHLKLGLESRRYVGEDLIMSLFRISNLILTVHLIVYFHKLFKGVHNLCNLVIWQINPFIFEVSGYTAYNIDVVAQFDGHFIIRNISADLSDLKDSQHINEYP